jgi:hypothetical protein
MKLRDFVILIVGLFLLTTAIAAFGQDYPTTKIYRLSDTERAMFMVACDCDQPAIIPQDVPQPYNQPVRRIKPEMPVAKVKDPCDMNNDTRTINPWRIQVWSGINFPEGFPSDYIVKPNPNYEGWVVFHPGIYKTREQAKLLQEILVAMDLVGMVPMFDRI